MLSVRNKQTVGGILNKEFRKIRLDEETIKKRFNTIQMKQQGLNDPVHL